MLGNRLSYGDIWILHQIVKFWELIKVILSKELLDVFFVFIAYFFEFFHFFLETIMTYEVLFGLVAMFTLLAKDLNFRTKLRLFP